MLVKTRTICFLKPSYHLNALHISGTLYLHKYQ